MVDEKNSRALDKHPIISVFDESNYIKDAINDAMKEVQKEAARKMMEEGGGLSGLLGGLGK